jgi:hypothetical protein
MARLTPAELQRCRDRWVAWMEWFLATYPERVPSRIALGRELDVSSGAITELLRKGGTRAPSFETLLHSSRLLGFPLDALVFTDPPKGTG